MMVAVIKLNLERQETWRYRGRLLLREPSIVILEAFFDRDDFPFHGITLRRGDRFVETYYIDRWYNIFEIHDLDDDRVKGWYCNITYPAQIQDDCISYVDLALDLLVYPDGRQLILDEDEFKQLTLSAADRVLALEALADLQACFRSGQF